MRRLSRGGPALVRGEGPPPTCHLDPLPFSCQPQQPYRSTPAPNCRPAERPGGPAPRGRSLPTGGAAAITDREFDRIRELIYREAGIALSDSKRALVCSRLAKRLRALNLGSHTEYLEYPANRDPHGRNAR